ncbi:hypothetical protein DYB34_005552 [Aphanomyces astaci]|uniref:Uncharacterized protein n=1 Tax=Aphanomyces astaci TaxID=112090 RepID=A0A418BE23_APHAT|nr:hypothetical protein DYB34_005552 [Aphanomyces astaci]
MVAIVDDLAMPLTQGYTPYYATTNSILVWTITASLSYYWPVTHVVSLAQRCAIVQMDAQIVCTSGDIAIGHVSRLVTLAMLVLASKLVCFVAARILVRRRVANDVHIKSIFVYAGAKYLFELSKWMSCDVYYMDRMSAAMNGILTVQRHETMHALDIKLWRVFSVDLSDEASSIPNHHVHAAAYRRALPLIPDE